MKFDQVCVRTCDMNSTLGSVVPLAMFCYTTDFWPMTSLSRYNFEMQGRSPKPNTLSEFWVRKDSVGSLGNLVENFRVRNVLPKKILSARFFVTSWFRSGTIS